MRRRDERLARPDRRSTPRSLHRRRLMADETDRRLTAEPYEPPVTELIRDVLGDTGELVRIEVALARDELRQEVAAARASAIAIGAAAAVTVASFTMFI